MLGPEGEWAFEDPQGKAQILSYLSTLELQTYPIVFRHDLDGDGVTEDVTVNLKGVERAVEEGGHEVWKLLLQEAKTAA